MLMRRAARSCEMRAGAVRHLHFLYCGVRSLLDGNMNIYVRFQSLESVKDRASLFFQNTAVFCSLVCLLFWDMKVDMITSICLLSKPEVLWSGVCRNPSEVEYANNFNSADWRGPGDFYLDRSYTLHTPHHGHDPESIPPRVFLIYCFLAIAQKSCSGSPVPQPYWIQTT